MVDHVRVFVGVCAGVENVTEAFTTGERADARYRKYAEEHNIPFYDDEDDFDWSESEYSAWTSRVEVRS